MLCIGFRQYLPAGFRCFIGVLSIFIAGCASRSSLRPVLDTTVQELILWNGEVQQETEFLYHLSSSKNSSNKLQSNISVQNMLAFEGERALKISVILEENMHQDTQWTEFSIALLKQDESNDQDHRGVDVRKYDYLSFQMASDKSVENSAYELSIYLSSFDGSTTRSASVPFSLPAKANQWQEVALPLFELLRQDTENNSLPVNPKNVSEIVLRLKVDKLGSYSFYLDNFLLR